MKTLLFFFSLLLLVTTATAAEENNSYTYADPKTSPVLEQLHKKAAQQLVATQNSWLKLYGKLPPKLRHAFEPAAIKAAQLRRPAMKFLINRWPDLALELTLGHLTRATLPANVLALLERQLDGTGDVMRLSSRSSFDGKTSFCIDPDELQLSVKGETFFNPAVYGRRLLQRSKEGLPVHGIVLDNLFAWSEEPFRLLDALERQENNIPADGLGVIVGTSIVPLKTTAALDDLRRTLLLSESYPGPLLHPRPKSEAEALAYTREWTTGPKTLLWVPVDFDEAPGSTFTRSADTDYIVAQADEWLQAISRRITSIEATYFPEVLRLPAGSLGFPNFNGRTLINALAAYDAAHGATGRWLGTSWDRVAFVSSVPIPNPDGSIARGAATVDGRYMMFYGLIDRFFMHHELGHSYLFGHSDYFRPATANLAGPGTVLTGINWDFMGQAGGDQRSHPNGFYKMNSYWFEPTEWKDASAGGRFYLSAHDTGPRNKPRGLLIRTDGVREYWVDMRRLWPEETDLSTGVQIHYWERRSPTEVYPIGMNAIGRPSPSLSTESPFQAGEVFEDLDRGVRITISTVGLDPTALGVHYALIDVERF